jgi:hypothetical protein
MSVLAKITQQRQLEPDAVGAWLREAGE